MADLGFKGERGYSAYEIAVQHGYVGTEESWLASIGSVNGYKRFSKSYTTSAEGEDTFALPEGWTSNAILEVYVDGKKIPEDDYQVDQEHRKVILDTPIQNTGVKVEIQVLIMSVSELPIVQELTDSSTDNTVPSAKAVNELQKTLKGLINEANDLINKVKVPTGGTQGQVLTKGSNSDYSVVWASLDWLNKVYPIGSIYMSVNTTDPGTLFGGTWQRIQDRFLLASGTTYKNGATGGEATHKLTVSEMPSHNHTAGDKEFIATDRTNVQSGGLAGGQGLHLYSNNATNNTGGNSAHNNMPPYLAICVWKRTA